MFIRRTLIAFSVVALVLSFSALAIAAQGHTHSSAAAASKEFTAAGEIVDMGCYMSHPATGKGAAHKECAAMCVQGGMPVGLLTSDGTLYVLLPSHDDPAAYAKTKGLVAEKVTVTGEKMMSGGVNAITVKSAEAAPKS